MLSAGQVSPKVLWDFKEVCLNYFNHCGQGPLAAGGRGGI